PSGADRAALRRSSEANGLAYRVPSDGCASAVAASIGRGPGGPSTFERGQWPRLQGSLRWVRQRCSRVHWARTGCPFDVRARSMTSLQGSPATRIPSVGPIFGLLYESCPNWIEP